MSEGIRWVGAQITHYYGPKILGRGPELLAARLALSEEIPVAGLVGVAVWHDTSAQHNLAAKIAGFPNNPKAGLYCDVVTNEIGTCGNVRKIGDGYQVTLRREAGQTRGSLIEVPFTELDAVLAPIDQVSL